MPTAANKGCVPNRYNDNDRVIPLPCRTGRRGWHNFLPLYSITNYNSTANFYAKGSDCRPRPKLHLQQGFHLPCSHEPKNKGKSGSPNRRTCWRTSQQKDSFSGQLRGISGAEYNRPIYSLGEVKKKYSIFSIHITNQRKCMLALKTRCLSNVHIAQPRTYPTFGVFCLSVCQ